MQKNLHYDICALIVILAILLSQAYHRMTSGKVNRVFMTVNISCLLSVIFDIWAESFGIWLPIRPENTILRFLLFTAYFVFRNAVSMLYISYLVVYTDTWQKFKNHKVRQITLFIPYTVIAVSLIQNIFTGSIFYFDENLQYQRGDWMFILYVCSLSYFVYGTYYVIRYRALFTKVKMIALLSLFPFNVGAVIIQLLVPELMVEVFATSIAQLMIVFIVQRPDENVHSVLGVRNRTAYTEDMKRAFYNNKQMDIIMIKVTNHSSILSAIGTEPTGLLMKDILGRLKELCKEAKVDRDIYYVGRGGFTFVYDSNALQETEKLARWIKQDFNQSNRNPEYGIPLSVEIAIVECPTDIDDFKMLTVFENVFSSYKANADGIIFARDVVRQETFRLYGSMENIIARAIHNRSFEVYYQPIYSVKEKKFVSAEALIRLNDKEYGFVSPAVFIPFAEKSDAIHFIRDFVFEEVCKFIASKEFAQTDLKYIEVNLSMAQCMRPDMAKRLEVFMKKYLIPPECINLEITESAYADSAEVLESNLQYLANQGVTFSLDDYGTGYSNMERILMMPLSIVKLDKFFADSAKDPKKKIVLENTVRMFKELDMEIVIEGVEDEEQLQQFVDLGCDFVQGHYFSGPLSKNIFLAYLKKAKEA